MSAFAATAVLCACFAGAAAPSAPAEDEAKPEDRAKVKEGPRTIVTCEGPVEMTRDESGRTRLVLSGGVRLERGKLTASASSGELTLGPGGEAPEMVYVEGDVVVESPRFAAKAGAARFLLVGDPVKEGPVGSTTSLGAKAVLPTARRRGKAPAGDFTVTLERRRMRAIELRVGTLRVTCGGPVTWRESSREISVAGRLRAESETFVLRADSGVITLSPPRRRPSPEKSGSPSRSIGERPEERRDKPPPRREAAKKTEGIKGIEAIERIDLVGPVDVLTKAVARKGGAAAKDAARKGGAVTKDAARKGGVVRKARAARVVYSSAGDVLVLTGDPPPEIESTGVVLTAPEIRIHLREGRIESPQGKMRAIVRPRRPDGAVDPPARPKPLRRGEGPTAPRSDEGPSPGEDE